MNREKPANEEGRTRFRYLITMGLLTTYSIGRFYINDYPFELGENFLKYFEVTQKDVQFFCAIYSFPAIVLAVLSGPIVSKFGATKVCAVTGFIVFLSAFGYYLATVYKSFNVILAAQVLYGFSGEIFGVGQNTLFTQLFDDNGQTLAFGLSQSLNTLFETISNFANPRIYEKTGSMSLAFMMGAIVGGISAFCAFTWMSLQRLGWGSFKKEGKKVSVFEKGGEYEEELEGLEIMEKVKIWYKDVTDELVMLNILVTSIAQYNFYQLMTYVTECMVKRFKLPLEDANHYVALSLLLTIPCSQLYSCLAVGYGRKPDLLIFGCLSLQVYLALFLYLPEQPSKSLMYFTSFLFSQFYSITYSIGYSCLGAITPARSISMAYGLTSFLINLGFCLLPFVFGIFLEKDDPSGYDKANYLMALFGVIGLGLAIRVKIVDARRGGVLGLPEVQRDPEELGYEPTGGSGAVEDFDEFEDGGVEMVARNELNLDVEKKVVDATEIDII